MEVRQQFLTGERALFGSKDLKIYDTIFDNGESPLKESSDIEISGSMFRWKYPLWYCKNVSVKESIWFNMARAGVWYTDNIKVLDCSIEAPKNFRRCNKVELRKVSFSNAAETLWTCSDVRLEDVTVVNGDYFGMNCTRVEVDGLTLYGNYSFDGARDVVVRGSRLMTKDAFWNTENVMVYDSFITGEYLGWNAKNLTLINCTIESLQGMCYIDNLVMRNCKLINTTLAFEYSTVDAEISSKVDSVFNPTSGRITAKFIDNLILEKDKIDPSKTKIICTEG